MIPKVIHYCWFGHNEKSEIILKCIDSWKKMLPDYEIIEWNEDNFDVTFSPFAEAAYNAKKWAFVSDVARLKIVHDHGGIYMDTDVELLKDHPFDDYLEYDAFFFVGVSSINTGTGFAGHKGNFLVKELLNSYDAMGFDLADMDRIVCTDLNTPVIKTLFPDLRVDNTTQIVDNHAFISEFEYWSFAKHYMTSTWCNDERFVMMQYARKEHSVSSFRLMLMKAPIWSFLEKHNMLKLKKALVFLVYDLFDYGLLYWIMKAKRKIFGK